MQGELLDGRALFAERTADMCIKEWDHTEIKTRMSLFPKEHEKLVATAVEQQLMEMRDAGELDE